MCHHATFYGRLTKRRIKRADWYREKIKIQTCHLTRFAMRDKKIKDIMYLWLLFLRWEIRFSSFICIVKVC